MKRILVAVACMFATVGVLAQGAVNFSNYPADVRNAYLDADGTTLLGASYVAQLYVGTSASSLAPVGSLVAFKNSGTAGTGYFLGGSVSVGVAWGTSIFAQVYVFPATFATYAAAAAVPGTHIGQSGVVSLTLPPGTPPPTPPDVSFGAVKLTIVPGVVPEPSTIALGLLGLGLLMLRRRS